MASDFPIDPRRLRVFLEVAELGKITLASRRLALSQPAVTAQLHKLEAEVGASLFLRRSNGVVLTPAGRTLFEAARRIQSTLTEVALELRTPGKPGVLELGASTTVASYILPPVLAGFVKQVPGLGVRLVSGNTADMLTAVKRGSLALAIVEGLPRAAGLTLSPLLEDELVLVGPLRSRVTGHVPRKVADLHGKPLLWRETGSGTRAIVERALSTVHPVRQVEPQDLELGHTEAIKTAVLSGLGWGFLSGFSVERERAAGLLQVFPLRDLSIYRSFSLVTMAGVLPSTAHAFIEFLRVHPPLLKRHRVSEHML